MGFAWEISCDRSKRTDGYAGWHIGNGNFANSPRFEDTKEILFSFIHVLPLKSYILPSTFLSYVQIERELTECPVSPGPAYTNVDVQIGNRTHIYKTMQIRRLSRSTLSCKSKRPPCPSFPDRGTLPHPSEKIASVVTNA